MGDLVGKAQLLAGGCGVAAADDGHSVGIGQRLRNGDRAFGKRRVLEHAHRPVPDDGLCALDRVCKQRAGLLADVQTFLVSRDRGHVDGFDLDRCVDGVREISRDDGIDREQQLYALLLGLLHHILAVIDLLRVKQALADAVALGRHEGIGHATADDERVDLLKQVIDDVQLVGNLCAAENRDKRTLRIGKGLAHDGDFLLHQIAADGGQVICNTGRGGVRAVRGAEGVVDKNISHGGKLLGKLGVVLRLALFKAGVLKQHDLAVL